MSRVDQSILLVASFAANWFSGGGAGSIQFPILIFLGLPFAVALATHKFATVFLGIGAILPFGVKHYTSGQWPIR